MNLGKSIRIYLDGGDVSGIRHAELVNWTGQALLCPRSRLGELMSAWSDQLKKPGVYFLIGAETTSAREVYVGESESVLGRLRQHLEKDFWQEVVVVTSKDENLTKSHIKYLESRLVALIKNAKRYEARNGNTPPESGLPRPDRDAMEEFLQNVRLLLGALGHRFLDPLIEAAGAFDVDHLVPGHIASRRLTYAIKEAVAHGYVTDEGFVVLKGSRALPQENESMSSYAAKRAELVTSKGLIKEGDLFTFTEDTLFKSPTAAAVVISGSSTNGRVVWKAEDGRTLKMIEEQEAKTSTDLA